MMVPLQLDPVSGARIDTHRLQLSPDTVGYCAPDLAIVCASQDTAAAYRNNTRDLSAVLHRFRTEVFLPAKGDEIQILS